MSVIIHANLADKLAAISNHFCVSEVMEMGRAKTRVAACSQMGLPSDQPAMASLHELTPAIISHKLVDVLRHSTIDVSPVVAPNEA